MMIRQPTDEQNRIINHNGNTVVTAKPGSGKTYTIVEKIAEILPGLPAHKGVIAISFTNKASDELKKRCKYRCSDTKQSFFGTIDKFYVSQVIIPFASHVTGKITDYEIIDTVSAESRFAALSKCEGELSPTEIALLVEGLREGKIFLKYTGETALYLLENVPGTLFYIKARYSHIIIDEYQDCGGIQDRIFIKLVENGLIGIAVGDINQAIYGFTNRFPKFLIALIGRRDFTHFELSRNHRCHPGISEYSLCLFNASKIIPKDRRVFRVKINGDERDIAAAIDAHIEEIRKKYNVASNNLVAVLCRSNSTVSIISNALQTPHKTFEETVLDKDNSESGRFFRDLISSRFDENIFAVDYAEQLFSEEYDPIKYRLALSLCQSIFSYPLDTFYKAENDIKDLANLVCTQKPTASSINNLQSVICDAQQIKNYVPAMDKEINLMTLHKSKGLEYNIVFHLDMYKWIMPNEYGDETSVQQDLNLHYVGITRAKDVCYIMNGTRRYRKRQNDFILAEPSPFLNKPGLVERRYDVCWK